MATALQLATQLLPHLRRNVLAGHVRTYGYYAEAIGRDGSRDAIAMGRPLHLIGAACVLARVPVFPLHFVERADGEWRPIFESAASELVHVAPQWDLLAVSSRVYAYSGKDFDLLDKLLRDRIPRFVPEETQNPKRLWEWLIHSKFEGVPILERALKRYEEIVEHARQLRRPAGPTG